MIWRGTRHCALTNFFSYRLFAETIYQWHNNQNKACHQNWVLFMGKKPKHIFISYSRDDKAWVYEFTQALRDDLIVSVFVDIKGIYIAADWWRTICENIEACDYVIYVMSPKSTESIYCTAEIDYAVALNKPILPIMLKECPFPQKLSDRRVQFFPVTNQTQIRDVLYELVKGISDIRERIADGDFRPPHDLPIRPDVPKPKDTKSAEEVFDMAVEWMHDGDLDRAEGAFLDVIKADNKRLGQRAKDRLEQIQSYQQVARRVDNPRLRDDAQAMWIEHVKEFGASFDPHELAKKFLVDAIKPPIATPKPPVIETHPITEPSVGTAYMPSTNIPPKIIKPKTVLPAPFDWCYIPQGDVKLTTDAYDADIYIKKDTILNVPAFWMAKYPVTNAQFAEFIKAGGYQTDKWWTKAGIAQRNSDKWTQSRYWDNKKRNGAEYPVVGVSWYEAVAYCNWLSEKTGEKIMLPNDAQWQRAAQGDDGRVYPWGKDWNGDLCNNSVKPHDSNNTTPVQKYEGKGNSPFDVVDMAGNVWEWCMTAYKTGSNDMDGTDVRMLRGGSWLGTDSSWFRVSFRSGNAPNGRDYVRGFRFARF